MRQRRTDTQNLDSLLDTMTNVVGVLIVLMAVTQLSVGDAMERIREIATKSTAVAEAERVALTAEWASFQPQIQADALESEALSDDLEQLRAAPEAATLRGLTEQQISQERISLRRKEASMSREVEQLRQAGSRLEIAIRDLTLESAVGSIRLPDPRPAPAGTRELPILCRYQRCFYADLEGLSAALRSGVEAAVGVPPALLPQATDTTRLETFFARRDLGSTELRIQISAPPRARPRWRLVWRNREAGEGASDLLASTSRFRQALASHPPEHYYALFAVWPDSYETYVAARHVAERSGYAVGWEPWAKGQEFERELGLRRFGHPTPID